MLRHSTVALATIRHGTASQSQNTRATWGNQQQGEEGHAQNPGVRENGHAGLRTPQRATLFPGNAMAMHSTKRPAFESPRQGWADHWANYRAQIVTVGVSYAGAGVTLITTINPPPPSVSTLLLVV